MVKGANQKLKLPLLARLLLCESDEDHPMQIGDLVEALKPYGIKAERKSLYDDMAALRALGLDVQCRKGKRPGWFVGKRFFELAELKLLVDAVQSYKFISPRKSEALLHKLEMLAGRHQARQLWRQVYVADRVKTMDESMFHTIDKLHTAIAGKHTVTFRYFDYGVEKEKIFRREGRRYQVSPYGLLLDNGNYYLAGFDHQYGEPRHYRVDKMSELGVANLPWEGACADFNLTSYAQKHLGMFSGREGQITLRCGNHLAGVILDRFGRDVTLIPDGEGRFSATVPVVVSSEFLGWLFGLGTEVELVGPGWAVEAFYGQLAAVAEPYQAPPCPERGETTKAIKNSRNKQGYDEYDKGNGMG